MWKEEWTSCLSGQEVLRLRQQPRPLGSDSASGTQSRLGLLLRSSYRILDFVPQWHRLVQERYCCLWRCHNAPCPHKQQLFLLSCISAAMGVCVAVPQPRLKTMLRPFRVCEKARHGFPEGLHLAPEAKLCASCYWHADFGLHAVPLEEINLLVGKVPIPQQLWCGGLLGFSRVLPKATLSKQPVWQGSWAWAGSAMVVCHDHTMRGTVWEVGIHVHNSVP